MKKLIVLSTVCLLALGTFASTGHKTKQDAKAKPATATQASAKAPVKSGHKPIEGGKSVKAKKVSATKPK